VSPDGLERMPDESLVEQFQSTGEMKYFAEIWRRHVQPVFFRCVRFLRRVDAAEDVTADTFLRALQGIGRYHPENLSAWLATIARNLCVNRMRSAAARNEHMTIEHLDSDAGEGRQQFAAEVQSVLNQLPDGQRRTLKLFFIDGYSYKEIVRLTGYSIKEVKSHIQNGRRRFRLLWERGSKAGRQRTKK